MFELRIYQRRPSCEVRFRHGGVASVVPLAAIQVVDAIAAKTGTGDVAVVAEVRESAKVLPFPVKTERPARKAKARPSGRPKGRKKS
jgi:hypothetical protein